MTYRPLKSYRGSKRRVRRLHMFEDWPVELTLAIAVVLAALFFIVPRLFSNTPTPAHHHARLSRPDSVRP